MAKATINAADKKELKIELQKRHDAGEKNGDDRLHLDALEYIIQLENIITSCWILLKKGTDNV